MYLRLSFLLAALLLSACSEPETTGVRGERAAPRVLVEPLALTTQRTRVEAVGTSRAVRSITIFPAVADEVVAIHFSPGQYVEQGQLLLELDQRDEKLAVELAEVRLQEAKRLFNRYRDSVDSGATLPTTLDAARAELDAARIALDRARIELADHNIVAPFSGHVGLSDIDTGDRIQADTPVTTLDDRSALLVSFDVPEVLIDRLKIGDEIDIATWNSSAERAFGEVIAIDSRVNPETRTFVTRAQVNNETDQLRPGMSFRVILDMSGERYPVLPEISLQWGAEGSYVWTIVDGQATRVPVEIVQRQQGRVLVDSGLQEGDLVVVEGVQRLRPGIEVMTEVSLANEAPSSQVSGSG